MSSDSLASGSKCQWSNVEHKHETWPRACLQFTWRWRIRTLYRQIHLIFKWNVSTISEANNSWECQWNTLALARHLQTRKAVFPARCEMIKVMIKWGGWEIHISPTGVESEDCAKKTRMISRILSVDMSYITTDGQQMSIIGKFVSSSVIHDLLSSVEHQKNIFCWTLITKHFDFHWIDKST